MPKMTESDNNPNLDFVNIKAYKIFDELLSICSEEIERKQNSDINQGPGGGGGGSAGKTYATMLLHFMIPIILICNMTMF